MHVYTYVGAYTVFLQVSGPSGSDAFTRTRYITVSEPPEQKVYLPLVVKNHWAIGYPDWRRLQSPYITCVWRMAGTGSAFWLAR
jgi:PKD repeat protein